MKPVIHPPRKVSISMKENVKTELLRMESEGVIKKQTEPTDCFNSDKRGIGLLNLVTGNKLVLQTMRSDDFIF